MVRGDVGNEDDGDMDDGGADAVDNGDEDDVVGAGMYDSGARVIMCVFNAVNDVK